MTGNRLERALAKEPALQRLLLDVRAALSGDVYVVGGFLRDLAAGRRPADLDLSVSADPSESAEYLGLSLGGSPFALDSERGNYRVTLPGALRYVDLAALRGDISTDLGLRDFTVDALAAPLLAGGRLGPLLDPFHGLRDIEKRTVRLVSEQALADDPLRLLRGPRLAAELNFKVAAPTAEAIRAQAPSLQSVAAERKRDELVRILATERASDGLRLLDSLAVLEVLLPEIAAERGVEQPKEHYYDVFDHSLETVAVLDALLSGNATYDHLAKECRYILGWYPLAGYFSEVIGGHSRLALTKLAALYHDVAKPETKAADATGRIRFLGHPEVGARTTAQACRRLRFGSRESRFVSLLVEEHLRPTQLSTGRAPPSDRAIYRFGRDLGDAAPACLILTLADAAAAAGPRLTRERWQGHVAYVSSILSRLESQEVATSKTHQLVKGDTIMVALGIEPGPRIGRLLAAIEEAAATGEVSTVDEAIALARSINLRLEEEASKEAGAA